MKTKSILIVLLMLLSLTKMSCIQNDKKAQNKNQPAEKKVTKEKYKVTFIELGSVRCIPCQKMQPIMKSIEEKYPEQVNVVFHDVWTSEGKPFADKYDINVLPTQIFLNENGNEYFRHEGFFPEEKLVKVLKKKGVK